MSSSRFPTAAGVEAVLAAPSSQERKWLYLLIAAATLSSFGLAYLQDRTNAAQLRSALQSQAEQVAADSAARIHDTAHGLRGARGYILGIGVDQASMPTFRTYFETRNLPEEFPGVLGVGAIRRVAPESMTDYVEHVRANGNPSFEIRSLATHDGERRIIEFVEPVDSNSAAVGLDVASEVSRRLSTDLALQTENDQPVLTAPIRLVQSKPGSSLGMLMVLRFSDSMRSSRFGIDDGPAGYVYSPIQLDDLLAANPYSNAPVRYQVLDVTPGEPERSYEMPQTSQSDGASELMATVDRPMLGRVWRFEARPTPELVASLNQTNPASVLAAGLVLTMLLALLFMLRLSLQHRTRAALAERIRLGTLLDNATDAIVGLDALGRVQLWNQAATRLFGYTTQQALNRDLQELIGSDKTLEEQSRMFGQAIHGRPVAALETTRRHHEGREVQVEASASPVLDADGLIVGVAEVFRPIQERMEQVRRLKAYGEELETLVNQRTADLAVVSRDLRQVLDGVPALIGASDVQQNLRFANRALSDLVGGELHEKKLTAVLQSLLGSRAEALVQAVLRGMDQRLEFSPPQRPDQVLDMSLVPERTDDGAITGLFLIATDVSALKTAEQRMSSIIDATGVGTWEWNAATGETRFNERWAQIVGFTTDELTPISIDTWTRLAHPEDLRRSGDALQRHFTGETERYECEVRMRHKDGHWVWVHDRGRVISRTPSGAPEWVFGTHLDITERKLAEEKLTKQNELTTAILQSAPMAVSVARLTDNRMLMFNEQYARMVQLTATQAAELDPSTLYIDGEAFAEIHRQLSAGQSISNRLVELRLPGQPQASHIWVQGTYMPIEFNGESAALAWLYDVTELRQAREIASRSQELQVEALEATQAGLAIFDAHDRLEFINRRMQDMYARAAPKLQPGITFATFVRSITEAYRKPDDPTTEQWTSARMRSHRPGSSWMWQLADGRTIRVVERELSDRRFVSLRLDVTELVAARVAAEAASRAKSDFLASTSHEIRTPLNAILGLTYLLERQSLPDGAAHQVRRISQAGRSLLGLLNDVLDLSKIEAQQLWIENEPVQLRQLVADEVDVLAAGQTRTAVAVRLHLDPRLPELVMSDPQRLRQILSNLVGNAIKFTEQGEVLVTVRPGAEPATVDFEVKDTGIGMSEEVQQRLFRPFEQADASISRRFGGTGLGLSITGSLVALMGGSISLRSEPDRGSTFTVRLPLRPLDKTVGGEAATGYMPRHETDLALLPGVRVLVVDDSPLNLEVARSVLALEAALVTTADNGLTALSMLDAASEPFDAVLLDVMMPDIDGIEVVRRIRADPAHRTLPVVALTAGVLNEQRDAAIQAGMSDFLQKPLDPPQLIRCLRRHIEARRGQRLPSTERHPMAVQESPPTPMFSGIDFHRLVPPLARNRSLLLSMIRRLVSDFQNMDLEVTEALGADLHRLKGSAATVGARELATIAGQAESMWRTMPQDPDLPILLRELEKQMTALGRWVEDQCIAAPEADPASVNESEPPDEDERAALCALLEDNNAQSLRWVEQRRDSLAAWIGAEAVDGMIIALRLFDFDTALELIKRPDPPHVEKG